MLIQKKEERRKGKKKDVKLLVVLLVLSVAVLIGINYSFINKVIFNFLEVKQDVHVDRIIDGDTFETSLGNVRLSGINTPEKGDLGAQEAKDFLSQEVLDKNVTLEFIGEKYDKYDRLLAYVFVDDSNINVKMVEAGFANYYFYDGKDKYSNELLDAWNQCLENNVNLCELSDDVCSSCIKISGSAVINSCSSSCDITNWSVNGEGREKFIYSQKILNPDEKYNFVLDLTNTGQSLFLRDDDGKLVEWKVG